MNIGKRKIGQGEPTFIVAEMSANHNQSFEKALRIIDFAAESGVDAIKIQTYTPETMTINSKKKWFLIKSESLWKGNTLYELYTRAQTPWKWQKRLKEYAEEKGLIFFSTPFDFTAVDFLESLDVQMYKIASFENTDIDLLRKVGQTKKPVILSRGMASVEDIELAISILKTQGTQEIALLHCLSAYPAPLNEMNLATIPDMASRFNVITGLSDHTLNPFIPSAAVALGASIIEKHVTISRSEKSPDAAFSLEPKELKTLVQSIREVEQAIGQPFYEITSSEERNIIFKRSLFVVEDIKNGGTFTRKNVRSIRPGFGLEPRNLDIVIGRKASKNISKGTPLTWNHVEK